MTGDPWALRANWPEELRQCPLLVKPFTLDALGSAVAYGADRRGAAAAPAQAERRMTAGRHRRPVQPTPSPPCGNTAASRPGACATSPPSPPDLLDASGVVPVNAAARARPSERTIRFYVTRGPGEPARRAGHRGGLFLPPPAPGARHQAAPDGGRDAGGDGQGVRRAHRRPDRAAGGHRLGPDLPRPDRLRAAPGARHRPRPGRAARCSAGSRRWKAPPPRARSAAGSRWPPASSC